MYPHDPAPFARFSPLSSRTKLKRKHEAGKHLRYYEMVYSQRSRTMVAYWFKRLLSGREPRLNVRHLCREIRNERTKNPLCLLRLTMAAGRTARAS